jgi:transposase
VAQLPPAIALRLQGKGSYAVALVVIEELLAEKGAQEARHAIETAALRGRIAELERQAGLNSTNSSKPPSSDGLKKPQPKARRVSSLRKPSGKKTGGQPGHPGETLRRTETPNIITDHYPDACAKCSAPLTAATATGYVARQVFDLPMPQPLICTEHRAHDCHCTDCGAKTHARFPKDVAAPVQYGKRIAAFVVYLAYFQFVPEQRLAELMAALFGVRLTTATIARMGRDCAGRFGGFVGLVRSHVAAATLKHMDETGFRICVRLQWLHIASTQLLTHYRVSEKRGSLLDDVVGIVVHDHWKPYFKLSGVLHALCNAHHLRELNALVEIEKEEWAFKMQRLLRRACHATNLARERNRPLTPRVVARFKRNYDAIVAEGITFHEEQPPLVSAAAQARRRGRAPRRTGHNLLVRLRDRKEAVLRFLTDLSVPFTNNLGERDARMMKLRQKISGCFRSMRGAQDFAVIRSLLSTARKQGWDLLETLNSDPKDLVGKLRVG